MADLVSLFKERVAAGLKRKSITKASQWAETYRQMNGQLAGKWTFKYHPWLREMHDSDAELNVGQKSAQMGYTELALNLTFYHIDIRNIDCLYILPSKTPDASDFSASRFDPALEASPHLEQLFSNVKNIGHKRAGSANLYIRGAHSKSGLRSIPVGFIIFDEVDVMNQDNISLGMERVSGQMEKKIWMISTPTHDEMGINKFYTQTTQEHFIFKCPCCSRSTELIYPDCLKITAESLVDPRITDTHVICKECKNELKHETKWQWLQSGLWVPSYENRIERGFYINQLYSSTVKPVEIAKLYFRAQSDPAAEQELYNSKLGLTHTSKGSTISDTEIVDCKRGYKNGEVNTSGMSMVTMGIDVGKWLHYEIDSWSLGSNASTDPNTAAIPRVIKFGKVKDFEELDDLIMKYGVLSCVIDANPEKRKALEFATRMFGMVKMCYYVKGITGKTINISKDPNEPSISVDRTAWLDLALGRFKTKTIQLPIDVDIEYTSHIKVQIKSYQKDPDGNYVARYIKPEHREDHYAHARNYAEIALGFAIGQGTSQSINKRIM